MTYPGIRQCDATPPCMQVDIGGRLKKNNGGGGGGDRCTEVGGIGSSTRLGCWLGSYLTTVKVLACLAFSLIIHLPFFFQFDIEECGQALSMIYYTL